jgi:SepF-like predicted cell division protein (DUF552 family)
VRNFDAPSAEYCHEVICFPAGTSDVKPKRAGNGDVRMGLMSKILGDTGGTRATEDYVELESGDLEVETAEADLQVHIANIGDKSDVITIKDAVYDGDIVIADITRHSTQDREMEHITDELKQVAREVGGDIVQKDDDQLIITPAGISISRERLGR